MKRLAQGIFLSALLMACAQAAGRCSNSSISGAYGLRLTGTNIAFNVQYAMLGQFRADGKRLLTGAGTQMAQGRMVRTTFRGEYTVAPDCTGTAKLMLKDQNVVSLEFVIVDDGRRIEILVIDPGTVESGVATLIASPAYTGPSARSQVSDPATSRSNQQ